MKRHFAPAKLISVAAFLLLLWAVPTAYSQQTSPWDQNISPLPAPTGHINDYVGVFDEPTKTSLEQRLREYKTRTGVELAVAVVKTTGDRPIFDYSLAVARGWKIGSKQDDNPGALLFIAVDDRKYFTQISRDLEDELPDGQAGSLQRQFLVPEFKKGNYAKGISDTLAAYIRVIDQKRSGLAPETPTPESPQPEMSGSQAVYSTFCCLVVIGVILLIIWSNRGGGGKSKRDRDRWGGGFGGGGSALPWIIGSAIGSSSSSDWGSSSWGSGSGGSDWGGFGGGGDFGGGGAGGDW